MRKRLLGLLTAFGAVLTITSCDSKDAGNIIEENKQEEKVEDKTEKTTLATPILSLNNKTVTWETVSNAEAYVVNVNGTDLEEQSERTFTLKETAEGSYEIKVKAISSDSLFESSDYSSKATITIEKEKDPEPSIVLNPTTLWIVGDSTVCSFNDNYYLPRYGYGTQLNNYLDSKVTIKNLALSGRSSRSFIIDVEEFNSIGKANVDYDDATHYTANYKSLVSGIKSGDYLMFGFGHNDEKNDTQENIDTRYCAPNNDSKDIIKTNDDYNFQYILNKYYIEMATNAGATPILCTPIVRLNSSNNYDSSSGHITSSGNYSACIKDLGEDTDTTVIDLTGLTKEKYKALTYDEAKLYHAVSSCKYDTDGKTVIPDYSSIDNTHINKYGAKEVSYLLTNTLKSTANPLGLYVKSDISEPTKSVDYNDAINTNMEVSVYEAVNWANYSPSSNMSTITKSNLKYNSESVGYGWVGTVFGSIGGTTKKWYATETSAGTFKVGQSAIENSNSSTGKIVDKEEGYSFLFSQIDANYNFTVTATLTVLETSGSNQAGFGIMLRDDCYTPNKVNCLTNNVVAGLYCSSSSALVANWSREDQKLNLSSNKVNGTYAVNDTAEITLTRAGQVVNCTVTYKGSTYKASYNDFDFTAIDSRYMYVGIIATRGTVVTTSNLNLTINGVAQAA